MTNRKFKDVPTFAPLVFHTDAGTPYFKEAGAALVAATTADMEGFRPFLDSFADELDFSAYLDDPDTLADADQIVKAGGQLCYLSFGPKRSKNADAARYFDNIKRQQHGSVLEHVSFSILFWGVDRTFTHEMVRHRHLSFSQVSQRYVGVEALRFVLRPERDPDRLPADTRPGLRPAVEAMFYGAHADFDDAAERYRVDAATHERCAELGHPMLQADTPTERRKRVQQVARDMLPGCVEAPILVSGNARSWRNFIDQRATPYSDIPIRDAAVKALLILQHVAPLSFGDYRVVDLDDGTKAAETEYRKV